MNRAGARTATILVGMALLITAAVIGLILLCMTFLGPWLGAIIAGTSIVAGLWTAVAYGESR